MSADQIQYYQLHEQRQIARRWSTEDEGHPLGEEIGTQSVIVKIRLKDADTLATTVMSDAHTPLKLQRLTRQRECPADSPDRRCINLSPKKPNAIENVISMPTLVAKPQSKRHARAEPKHESRITTRSGILSERYPRSRIPGTEAAAKRHISN